jgi:hypothetical protein
MRARKWIRRDEVASRFAPKVHDGRFDFYVAYERAQ